MTGIQYMLLSMAIILPAGVFIYYFHQLSISESHDKIFKDGIKEVMLGGNKIILKGEMPRTIPQTEEEWAEYHEYIKDGRIRRCEGSIDPRGIYNNGN